MNLRSYVKSLPPFISKPLRCFYRIFFARQLKRRIRSLRRKHDAIQSVGGDPFVLRKGISFRIDPRSRSAFEAFCFESPEMVSEMNAFVASANGRNVLFDVGAFHGAFSFAFVGLNPLARSYALEPSSGPFSILSENCRLNPSLSVVPLSIAAGRSNGAVHMVADWEHLVAISDCDGEAVAGSILVEQITLDELAIREAVFPDIIKIDVEGFEVEVLAGARECLKGCKVLHLELHPEQLVARGESPSRMLKDLVAAGFRAYSIDGHEFFVGRSPLPESTFRVTLVRK